MSEPVFLGDAVRVERRYPHPIERVWRAVTTPVKFGSLPGCGACASARVATPTETITVATTIRIAPPT